VKILFTTHQMPGIT